MEAINDFFAAAFLWLAMGFILAVTFASQSKSDNDQAEWKVLR